MDADTFYNFIEASDYLLLQGDKYKRFARNMVRKGVLGKHSMAIVRQHLGTGHMGYTSLFWSMLIALASECGCEVRVMKHDDHKTEVTLCSVDDKEAESYGDICSVFETRPVIDRLSVRCNILSDRADRMEILTWLTDHLEVTLLWIGTELRMTKEDTQSIVKWRSETRLGLSLDFGGYEQSSHSFALALIPTIPALKELHIRDVVFEPSAAHVFGQCVGLEKLGFGRYGSEQTSSFVSALMPNLPNIRELEIWVGVLSTDAAEAFRQCKRLEKLFFGGSRQTSSFVSALLPNLANIRELTVDVEELSPDAAVALGQCKRLEKLCLGGSYPSSSFVSALMLNIPNIRELKIGVEELSPDAAVAFRQCERLEKLHLTTFQNSAFIRALMPNLPDLKELTICILYHFSTDAAEAFGQCRGLEKLNFFVSKQTSPFVSALMPNLTNIRELTINTRELSTDAAEAFRQCKRLEKLCLSGSRQTSSFVSALLPNLTNIKELTIRVEDLSPDAAVALGQFKQLEKLHFNGSLVPGCIEHILSSPHMDSLRCLQVGRVMGGVSDGDRRAISEARKRHVVVTVR
jgi:hypothetical protein